MMEVKVFFYSVTYKANRANEEKKSVLSECCNRFNYIWINSYTEAYDVAS